MSDQQPETTPAGSDWDGSAPTVTEHNDRMHEQRPDDCVGPQ